MKLSNETKVGALLVTTLVLVVGFSWLIGVENPFKRNISFYVTYRFAGGVEVGSPVRVSGIKVGKVEKIEFFVPKNADAISKTEPGSADTGNDKAITPLRLRISLDRAAAKGVREDSRFYINIAGIIGERYVEITPGTLKSPELKEGAEVAGIDPPRIDQLLSQSFDLAGKITDIIEENKGDITKSIDLIYKLSGNLNETLKWVEKSGMFKGDLQKLIDNLVHITSDTRKITDQVGTPEGEKTLKLLHELIWRLEPINEKSVRKFFQEDGIKTKVRMF